MCICSLINIECDPYDEVEMQQCEVLSRVTHPISQIPTTVDKEDQNQWPTTVECDMKIEAWKESLLEFDLWDKYNYLIHGFTNGFHQGIPDHQLNGLRWFCPPNHSSANQVRQKIENNFKKEVEAKRLFGPYTKETVYKHLGFF